MSNSQAFLHGIRAHGSPDAAVIFKASRNGRINATHSSDIQGPSFGAGHSCKSPLTPIQTPRDEQSPAAALCELPFFLGVVAAATGRNRQTGRPSIRDPF